MACGRGLSCSRGCRAGLSASKGRQRVAALSSAWSNDRGRTEGLYGIENLVKFIAYSADIALGGRPPRRVRGPSRGSGGPWTGCVSPASLPEPPADYGFLTGFPVLDNDDIPRPLYRAHRVGNEPEWFGTFGAMRIDPPAAAGGLFGAFFTDLELQPHLMAHDDDGPVPTRVVEGAEAAFGLRVLPSSPLSPSFS